MSGLTGGTCTCDPNWNPPSSAGCPIHSNYPDWPGTTVALARPLAELAPPGPTPMEMIEKMGSVDLFRDPDGPWMATRKSRDRGYLSAPYHPTPGAAVRALYEKYEKWKPR